MANLIELNSENFASAIANGVVLVDFWAEWCGPCKMLAPILDQVAAEVGDSAKICKVNVDQNNELAAQYAVRNIPSIFIFKDGQLVNQMSGVQSKAKLLDAIKNA